ncbi:MAG: YbaB/EbfC family nucleoid-associated protein [Candidatus Limnocylindria bacterium]
MKMGNLAKMAEQMQAEMAQAQAELRETTLEATAGGGAVRVVITGAQELRAVHIDPAAADPGDVEMLQDLILAAVNEALARSKQLADDKMTAIAGSMGLPGLPGLR